MNCPKCGAEMADDLAFCTDCGAKLTQDAVAAAPAAEPAAAPKDAAPAADKPQQPEKPKNGKEPYGTLRFLGSLLLLLIPVLNVVLIFRWAFAWGVNINKRNFARAVLLCVLIVAVLHVAALVVWPESLQWVGAILVRCITFLFRVPTV